MVDQGQQKPWKMKLRTRMCVGVRGWGTVLKFFKGKSLDGAHQSPSGAFPPSH